MFSRSFIKSKNQDIALRAEVTRESVRRSPACSGEHNYTYRHSGFRAFQDPADDNYAQNLINDYNQVYEEGKPTLPYHAALTALHHKTASTAVTTFLSQMKTTLQLIHMHMHMHMHNDAPAPAPHFNTTSLLPFQIRRLVRDEYKEQAIRDIQRPLTDTSIMIAHAASRLQVTEINALKTHQRSHLTAFAAFAALLAIRFSAEKGHTTSVATMLHHRAIQLILRRATGSMACAQQISAPYIKCESPFKCLPDDRIRELRTEAERRFDTDNPSGVPLVTRSPINMSRPCSTRGGPIEYHTAKYYAQKCLELIGNPDDATDTAAVARWRELDAQIPRIRRGEITAHEVFASPHHGNWIYMVHYTYVVACRQFLSAIELWRDVRETAKSFAGPGNQCPSIWHDSHIRKDSPVYVQCVQIVHEMYRFIYRAACIMSPQYMAVFGLSQRYVNTIIKRTRYLAYNDGDETSALMFGFLMPAMMTPDVHLDIYVQGHVFQHPDLYVKMSDPVFGPIKKHLRDVIPARHTGTIDRTTLMNHPKIVRRA
jgi:hypothetical protein